MFMLLVNKQREYCLSFVYVQCGWKAFDSIRTFIVLEVIL